MLRFLTLVLIIFQSCCGLVMADEDSDRRDQMARQILDELTPLNGPGLQYVVVDNASTIFEYSTGLSDISTNKSLELHQTLAAFSMTKPLTAIAILQLVERNRLDLDDKLSDIIQHPYDHGVTIAQLLAHTSGIPNPIPLKWVHLVEDHAGFDESLALTAVLKKHNNIDSKPGVKYKYSNIGYWLLGKVIEQVSGLDYPTFIQKNIFSPLELTSADIGFLLADEESHAKGYLKKWSLMDIAGRFLIDVGVYGSNEGNWIRIKNLYPNGPSFGGAIGTARSFSVVLKDLLSRQSRLLGPTGKQLLYSQQSVASGKKIDMTLGWHIRQLDKMTYFYKEGGGAGFCCEMRVYPEAGLASVLMLNRTSFNFKKNLSALDRLFVQPHSHN